MIDIGILILLLWGGFQGFRRGIIMELFSALAVTIASISSFMLFKRGMHAYAVWSNSEMEGVGPYVLFAGIFAAVFLMIRGIGARIAAKVHISRIGHVLDGLLGGVLGMSKWVLGISTVLWIGDLLHVPQKYLESTVLLSWIRSVAPTIADWWQ